MLKKFSITIGAFFLLVLLMGVFISNEYEVKRSISINANPQQIHPFVEDLNEWPKWTPWQSADPSVEIIIGEISKGEGASQKWKGKSGIGELKITKSSPDYGVDYMLDMRADGLNTFSNITYQSEGTATEVTWIMKGQFAMPVIGAYIAMAMDGTAGPMYEQGLKKLKELVENSDQNP